MEWGSDAMAAAVRETGVPYIALNPGASFRGLHDSLVNYLGDTDPEMLICLHEEHAVALAHGWAKVTGEPLAAAVHSNVGLMHATMAVFNAYCDRVPLLLLGATGPLDADRRRPWIDWIHTSADQAALVRHYVKWDDQPGSPSAAVEAVRRANQYTRSSPTAPVYVVFDADVQEQRLDAPLDVSAEGFAPYPPAYAAPEQVRTIAQWLSAAQNPVLLLGRGARTARAWERRVRLAERLDARVVTDLKAPGFPGDHPLHGAPPGLFLHPENRGLLEDADVVLAAGWIDAAGAIACCGPGTRIVLAGDEFHLSNGWSKDHQSLPRADVSVPVPADVLVEQLLAELGPGAPQPRRDAPKTGTRGDSVGPLPSTPEPMGPTGRLTVAHLQEALRGAVGQQAVTLVRTTFAWDVDRWPVTHPLGHLGHDGGAGVGSGPGIAVGAALALRDRHPERLPVTVLGDGDYLMGLTALWTAVHHRIPLLVLVANNNSYFNDEIHQERISRVRSRDLANVPVGLRLDDPAPDLAMLARGQGATGHGPVRTPEELDEALRDAVGAVRAGGVAVVDVQVERGYGNEVQRVLSQ